MNHYQRLGVVTSASQSDIKRAYRDLVKIYHPDLNPKMDTHVLMQEINEAYEVLSDVQSRNLYDLALSGYAVPSPPPEETEAERYRREYKRKKAHEERVHMENLIKLKFKFYKAQRYASYVFFALGILFTLDYYLIPFESDYEIETVRLLRRQTEIKLDGGKAWMTDRELLEEFSTKGGSLATVSYSLVFRIPARINLEGSRKEYRISGTLHSFRNIITWIILVFSAIVINNKEYTDFRLTCGLVPVLLVIFQMLMVLQHLTAPE